MAWTPIADVESSDTADPAVPALAVAMHDHIKRLHAERELEAYLERLRRSWAIETGILERLYEVSDAATKTLLEHGLDAAYLASGDTGGRDPKDVVSVLKDQKAAIDGLYTFIREGGQLTKSFIRQLHQLMTAHQPTYEAEDINKRRVVLPLEPGKWKTQPNSVGNVEVCPPMQVDSEIERLLELDAQHVSEGIAPVLQSAWIHHRFLLIHPFADGNGRIARCLATLVLLRAGMMPLVIERGTRGVYIDALRSADHGDLGPFVRFIEGIQRKEIQRAMDVAFDMRREQQGIKDRISALGAKLQRRAAITKGQRQALTATADQSFDTICSMLDDIKIQLEPQLKAADPAFRCWTKSAKAGSPESSFNWFQVTRCAKKLDYYANDRTYQAWAYLGVNVGAHHEILFSMHGMGPGETDVIACSAMRYDRHREDGLAALGEVHPLVEYPFTFTIKERPQEISDRFRRWMSSAIDAGLEDVERAL